MRGAIQLSHRVGRNLVRGKCVCVSRARNAHFYVDAVLAVLEMDGVAFKRLTRSEVVHLQKR